MKINNNLKMSKKELNLYIKQLKEKYDIPTKYVTDELLEKTKNKEIVINKKTFKIELPNIWKLKESSNTEYQIHTLNQIIQSQIALFFYKEYDINIIKYCIKVIENWFDNNEKIELSKWYNEMNANWQDMSTSYRLGNILLVYELAIKFKIKINEEKFRVEILYHIEWLKSNLIHNNTLNLSCNHNLFISRYLILGANNYNIYFNKLEDSYIELGVENFIEAISNNVDMTDLLSKEHSTNYHILYYRQLNKLLSILDENNKNYKKLKELSDGMYNNLNYFIYPNNHFVQIGDTDDKLCNYEFKDLEPLKVFKKVGYGVYKKENIYLSLSSSCHSKYHKHMDELSINYFNEYPILIEGGRYSYDDNKPKNINERWRNTYFLSQRSKNSVVIDDNYFSFRKIINELNDKTYTYASGITRGEIKDNGVVIQGTNPLLLLMKNIEHNRKVNLDKNNILLVEDKLVSHDEKEHKGTRHFHFHYDWELVEIVKNKVIFKHKISNKMIKFEDLSNGEIKYYYGQEKPFIQGFTSDYEHHKIKVPTIEIINTFSHSIQLNSNLKIYEKIQKLELLDYDMKCRFLDHVDKHIISSKNNIIYESYDLGITWEKYNLDINGNILSGKIINSKIILAIRNTNNETHIYLCDENRKIESKTLVNFPWHGTWSTDYNENTIMFGTYARCDKNMRVYRSIDGGHSWNIIFNVEGPSNNDTKSGDIRHFHTCTYDKYTNKWYLSSGDCREQNKMWESTNNGDTWNLIKFKKIKYSNDISFKLTSNYSKQLIRHTSEINIDKNIMIWCTDDKLDGDARVCIFNKKTYDLFIGEKLGNNPIRSFTKINNDYGLAISESKFKDKNNKLHVNFYLVNLKSYNVELVKSIENVKNKISGFNYSIASKNAYNNMLFCYSDFHYGYLQIKIKLSTKKII